MTTPPTAPAVVLVGGAGSVGTELIRHAASSWRMVVVDRPDRLLQTQGAACIACDLGSPEAPAGLETALPFGHVVYLAGNLDNGLTPASVAASLTDNVTSLSAFFEVAHSKIQHFTYLSSISVYGRPSRNPISETDPIAPTSVYGIAKAAGERLALLLGESYRIPVTVLRVTQLYGLPSASQILPHRLADALSAGTPPPALTANPSCRRDYLAVTDLVSVIRAVVERPIPGVFNIGSGSGMTLSELFESAYRAFGRRPPRPSTATLDASSFSQLLDVSAARKAFDYEPVGSLDDWFRQQAGPGSGSAA